MHPTATEVVVRPAREQDLDAIVELFVEVAAEGRWIGTEPPVDRDRRRRRLAETLDQEREVVLVAEAGGRIIGQLGMDLAGYGVADLGMLVSEGWRGPASSGRAGPAPTRSRSRSGRTTRRPWRSTRSSVSSARACCAATTAAATASCGTPSSWACPCEAVRRPGSGRTRRS